MLRKKKRAFGLGFGRQQRAQACVCAYTRTTSAEEGEELESLEVWGKKRRQAGERQKGLRGRNSPMCTLSQNGYGDRAMLSLSDVAT